MPKVSFSYLLHLTDDNGILEHCILTTPDPSEGYSTDDNARALQLSIRLGINKVVPIYLKFLVSAHTSEGFHQDLNSDMTWDDKAEVNEGYGRAMAALGETAVSAPKEDQRQTATSIFDEEELLIKKIKHPRVIAQTIIGLSYRMKLEKNKFEADAQFLADKLAGSYLNSSEERWKWYEDELTYDNGRLPLAMFSAYQCLGNKKYLDIARQSLDFLIEETYDNTKKIFSFPGHRGWYKKGGEKAVFAQQPIEAGSMVEALVKAFEVTKERKYLTFAERAFSWYSGSNILGLSLIDQTSGGICDGLEPEDLNPNEGAESILGYLTAKLLLDALHI